jgi:hypothetical protein
VPGDFTKSSLDSCGGGFGWDLDTNLVCQCGSPRIDQRIPIRQQERNRDADGDNEDWIELFNADGSSVGLGGWFLTDDPANLTKWSFPDINIAPNSHLILFASGKNRTIPGAELHTNFKLQSEPGFLALVRPDLSVASHFNYPTQKNDVSFGPSRATTPLVSFDTVIKWFVPTDGSLSANWNGGNEPFDDAAWTQGANGVGYIGTNVASGNYSNLVRSDPGLVAYWRMDETSGSSVADAPGRRQSRGGARTVRGCGSCPLQ